MTPRNFSAINSNNLVCSTSIKSGASMIPSKMHIFVGPQRLMPAQTWTLGGWFGL